MLVLTVISPSFSTIDTSGPVALHLILSVTSSRKRNSRNYHTYAFYEHHAGYQVAGYEGGWAQPMYGAADSLGMRHGCLA